MPLKKRYTLAIDSHHLALLKRNGNQFFIEHLRTFEPHVKPLDILKSVLHRKTPQIVSGLSAKDVILRRIHLKLKTKREILSALPFQLEQHLPFPPKDTLVIPTLHLGKEGSDVDLLATTKDKLDSHLQSLREKDVDPDVITAEPIALFRFAQYLFPEHASLLIYHPKSGTLAVMKDRALVAFQTVREIDLQRALAYIQKKYPEIEQILNIGATSIETSLQCLKVENEDWIPYAIAIGLALDAAKEDEQSRQFRYGPLRAQRHKKREKKKMVGFFVCCALFCASVLTFGHLYLKSERETFLTSLHLPEGSSLQQISQELERAVRKKEQVSLALSNVLPVHEVLAWLSSHPKLGEDASITRLQYQITKCPRLGNKTKVFAAKVDVEFTTGLPRVARNFHESLLQDQIHVDKRHEVRFSSEHGLYKVSFYLKTRSL